MRYKATSLAVLFAAIIFILFSVVGRAQQAEQPNKGYLPSVNSGARVNNAFLYIVGRVFPLKLDPTSEPSVLTFIPGHGQPGDVITIHGQHFTGVVLVLFGTTPATDYRIISETEMTATVPEDAQSGKISLVTLMTSGASFAVGESVEPTTVPTATPAVPVPTLTPTVGATTVPTATTPGATATITPTGAPMPTSTPIATAAATVTPTATTAPPTATAIPGTPAPAQAGIWISQQEIDALPATGAGWTEVLAAADTNPGSPSLSNQDSDNNVYVMAEALVCAKTHVRSYCDRVITALKAATSQNLESGARALALGRELGAYVISADIIDLKQLDPATDALFRLKIKSLLTFNTTGGPANLIACDEERPNNWGGHCGASRIAVDLYLGDKADLDKAALVLRGWLGDRGAYAGFTYGDLAWQSDPAHPVGVNPVGGLITGHPVGGGQPEELRRGGTAHFPPTFTDYGWEGLQGRLASALMLSRAGYDSWNWSDKAILRAVQFLYDINWPAVGDDKWQIWIVDKVYGAAFAKAPAAGKGKNIGWTSWTMQ